MKNAGTIANGVLSNPKSFILEMNKLGQPKQSKNLTVLLTGQEQLRKRKSQTIQFAPPFLAQEDRAVFFPRTINVIQGQAGVHKSRLAEIFCAVMLKKDNAGGQLIGYRYNMEQEDYTVIYVDTERNVSDQFPASLQKIQVMADYRKEEHPKNFDFCSLIDIPRKQRFSTLQEYLTHKRISTNSPLFVVLDVITDCVEDFNRTDCSMALIDLLNRTINEHNVTFLCIIHENPNSSKARGHLGTELFNKASTVIQVGYEAEPSENNPGLIHIKYLKCRTTERHPALMVRYDKEEKGLILATEHEIVSARHNRQTKAPLIDVKMELTNLLADGQEMKREVLIQKLCDRFDTKNRTIEGRLKELVETRAEFIIKTSDTPATYYLDKFKKGKVVWFRLSPLHRLPPD